MYLFGGIQGKESFPHVHREKERQSKDKKEPSGTLESGHNFVWGQAFVGCSPRSHMHEVLLQLRRQADETKWKERKSCMVRLKVLM